MLFGDLLRERLAKARETEGAIDECVMSAYQVAPWAQAFHLARRKCEIAASHAISIAHIYTLNPCSDFNEALKAVCGTDSLTAYVESLIMNGVKTIPEVLSGNALYIYVELTRENVNIQLSFETNTKGKPFREAKLIVYLD